MGEDGSAMGQGNGLIPEEDRYIFHSKEKTPIRVPACKHEWVDMYWGGGVARNNVNTWCQYFFCKFCLRTQLVKIDQSMMRLNDEFEEEREEYGL